MSASILVAYASSYGSTQEVAAAVAAALNESGLTADVRPMREVRSLSDYRAVVMGAPLLMFHWHKDAIRFLARHQQSLTERPVAVFALGPTHDPYNEKEWQDSQAQLDQDLLKFPWFQPIEMKMFGGRYDPAKLGFPLKLFVGKAPMTDMRDWEAIRSWAGGLAAKLA